MCPFFYSHLDEINPNFAQVINVRKAGVLAYNFTLSSKHYNSINTFRHVLNCKRVIREGGVGLGPKDKSA